MRKTASFTIGKVTGVHGLSGNLKVCSFAESIDTFRKDRSVLLQLEGDAGKEFTIKKAWSHKKGILLSLDGIDNRNLAEDLIGCEIVINRDELGETEEDTWYWQDLIGLDVVDNSRGILGKIAEIFPTGANDMLVVKKDGKETLIPMHRHFVAAIDLENQVVRTTLPKGL